MPGVEQAEKVADWLVIVGALNAGLAGVGSFIGTDLNVINIALGSISDGLVANVVYVLIGASALWVLKGKLGK
tara:strand:- start:8039 stop:8257 length:219 start_codon:yes stop_codon:yes gene_type:complete